jgi:pilus assembly protein CpaE
LFGEEPVEVLLVGPSELTSAGLKRVGRWHAEHPATVVVLAAEKDRLPDPALVVKAGAEVLLRLPAGPAAVRRVLANALEVAASRRDALAVPTTVGEEVETFEPEVEEPVVEDDTVREPAITVTVASATGGCGKTFLATNLAFLLKAGTGKTVAMIDLDVQFGELVPTLQLKPHASIADVVLDEDGRADLTGLLTRHESGFDVLAAPPDPVAADRIGHGVVRACLEALRESYDYVIIDTPPSLNEVVLDAFDVSDHLVVLATLDIPSIRNMRVFLSTLERLRIRQDGVHLVLNKAERGVGLTSGDIQTLLGRTWDLELPYDREVSRSVNLGLPVSESAPGSEVSRRLVAGINSLVPGAAVQLDDTQHEPHGLARLLGAFRRRRTSNPLWMKEKTP